MLGKSLAQPALPQLLVDPREAARLLSISERTLWTLTNQGSIKATKIGRAVRYSVASLEAFIAKQTSVA